ncbi:PAS domain S-box protein [Bdellovibrionota bacterium]
MGPKEDFRGETSEEKRGSSRSAGFLFLVTLLSIFVAEALLNTLNAFFPAIPKPAEIVTHGLVLITMLFFPLYFFIFRPMNANARARRRVEEHLRMTNNELRSLLDSTNDGIIVADEDGNIVDWNPASQKIFGYRKDEVLNRPLTTIMPESMRGAHEKGFKRFRTKGDPHVIGKTVELTGQRKDNSKFPIELSLSEFKTKGRTFFTGIVRDITARKEEEETRSRLVDILDASPDFVGSATWTDKKIFYINKAGREMLGLKEDTDVTKTSMGDYYPERIRKSLEEFVYPILLKKGVWSGPGLLKHKDGRDIPVSIVGILHKSSDGKALCVSTVSRDVTEQVKEEETRLRLLQILNNTSDFIASATWPDLKLFYLNETARKLLNVDFNKPVQNLSVKDLIPKDKKDFVENTIFTEVKEKGIWSGETPIALPGGDTLPTWMVTFTHKYGGDGKTYLSCIARDLRDMKKEEKEKENLQGQLFQSQKLEAVGGLARGFAHHFNNQLSVINGYVDLALESLGSDHPAKKHLELVKKAGEKSADLNRKILVFSREQELNPKPINIGKLLEESKELVGKAIAGDVEFSIKHKDVGLGKIDVSQFEQVLLNLASNACDAMPKGGKLSIEAKNIDLNENDVKSHPGTKPGPYVLVSVSDTGKGIAQKTISHIFEPFFTTKEEKSGLGLSIAHGIIKQTGGDIWVDSEPGKGSTFKILFPRIVGDSKQKDETTGFVEEEGGAAKPQKRKS